MKVKELVWRIGPVDQSRDAPAFDVAITPFGEYKAWYSDGELWGPTPDSCFLGRHGTAAAARIAAYEHLCAGIEELVEE